MGIYDRQGFLGMVCTAHTHQITTPITGSTADRGTTSMIMREQTDSPIREDKCSGQHIPRPNL